MTTIAVPLSKLALSPLNVRQTTDADDTSDLEGSIIAHGLLAPLAAHPMARGKYGVIAGGRRLRALQALAERGEIDGKAYQVDVVLRDVADADATEISIIENTARVALPVVEEVRAFAKLAEAGDDPAAIARRFGTTELHVRQRMRLGQLHPDILAGLERGQITQDAAKAFAATTDHAAQKRAWDAGARAVTEVKAAMRRDLVNAGADRMLELVGLDAYVAAGGVADEDLFTPGEIRLRDVDVLKRLYDARLTEELAQLALPPHVTVQFSAEGVGTLLEVDGSLSDAQWERLQAIERELLTLELKMDRIAEFDGDSVIARWKALPGGDQDEVDRLVAERTKLTREGEQIKEGNLGGIEGPVIAVASIRGGALGITGYYRPYGWRPDQVSTSVTAAELPSSAAITPSPLSRAAITESVAATSTRRDTTAPIAAAAPRHKPVANGFRSDRAGMAHLYTQPEDLAREQHGLTRDAVDAMRSHHRAILGGALASGVFEHRFAAGALVFVMARGLLRESVAGEAYRNDPVESRLGVANLPRHAFDPIAMREELDAHPASDRQRRLVEQVQAFEWMREPDDAQALRLFTRAPHIDRERAAAAVFVSMLARSLGVPGFSVGVHDVIATLLDVGNKVRALWTPDRRFFERLPKGQKIAALDAVDPSLAKRLAGLGADALTEATAAVMSGSREAADKYGMDAAAVGRAKAWVPPYLSFREPEPADDDPAGEDDDANDEDVDVDVTEVGGAADTKRLFDPAEPVDLDHPFWTALALRHLESGHAFGSDPHGLKLWFLQGGGTAFCTTAPGHMAITEAGLARLAEIEDDLGAIIATDVEPGADDAAAAQPQPNSCGVYEPTEKLECVGKAGSAPIAEIRLLEIAGTWRSTFAFSLPSGRGQSSPLMEHDPTHETRELAIAAAAAALSSAMKREGTDRDARTVLSWLSKLCEQAAEPASIPRSAYMAELRKDVVTIAGERPELTLTMIERELPARWEAQKPSRVTLAKALTGLGWRKVERPGSGARYARPSEMAA